MVHLEESRPANKVVQDAKTHLDLSVEFFMRAIQNKSDQLESVAKAERTLSKASKIIIDLAWSVNNHGEDKDRGRSKKGREASESLLDNTAVSCAREDTRPTKPDDTMPLEVTLTPKEVRLLGRP